MFMHDRNQGSPYLKLDLDLLTIRLRFLAEALVREPSWDEAIQLMQQTVELWNLNIAHRHHKPEHCQESVKIGVKLPQRRTLDNLC